MSRSGNGITERDFARVVVGLAKTLGYRVQWHWLSIRSPAGYPDLTLVRPETRERPGRILWAELKTERGNVTSAQQEWLSDIRAAGGEAHIWRPSQIDDIAAILQSA